MKKIENFGNITNGKLHINKRMLFVQAIEKMEDCKVKITVERLSRKRSNDQNAYYWGVVIDIWQRLLLEEWGEYYTPEMTHEFLKVNFNSDDVFNEQTGEILKKTKSTTELTTSDFMAYLERCRKYAQQMFNCYIPEPNEQTEIWKDAE